MKKVSAETKARQLLAKACERAPICESKLVFVDYEGKKAELLALMKASGFCCLLGCLRVDLHDKVVDGVNYRGKVYVRAVFHARDEVL